MTRREVARALYPDMTAEKAIEVIKSNWPDGGYTMLRCALALAIDALEGSLEVYKTKVWKSVLKNGEEQP